MKLFDFAHPIAADAFRPVGDPVMGGVSRSEARAEAGPLVFTGIVSTDFGGGFASIEARVPEGACAGFSGLELRLMGDGRPFQLRVKTPDLAPSEAYRASLVVPAGTWQTVRIAFDALEPVRRGVPQESRPPVDPARIDRIGFLVAGEGPFRLAIERIRRFR